MLLDIKHAVSISKEGIKYLQLAFEKKKKKKKMIQH